MPEDRENSDQSLGFEIEEIEILRLTDVEEATDDPAQRRLRAALGQFATGVTIVTTLDASGKPVGMTVNSFSSVSLNPPLVLWSIAELSFGIDVFKDTEQFCINVLSSDQEDIAKLFAQASMDKFNELSISHGLNGIPKIDNCLAHFECTTEARFPGGDHIIILGRVAQYASNDREPLVFHAGQFCDLAPDGSDREA